LVKLSRVKTVKLILIATTLATVWFLSLLLANFVSNNEVAQGMVGQFGYLGILVLAIIAGVNVILPVPAATFVPVFLAAGMWMPFIIITLVIGTIIADYAGYFVGRWSREFAKDHYPNTYRKVLSLNEKHHNLLLPFVFFYAALVPFPNEAFIIPLALIGVKFRFILIPLILGNLINQSMLAFGTANIFTLLF
jgi:membrane protein YqaA with SNARE-associated domain